MPYYRVDPKKITDYDRTNAELQTFFLFSVAVAGKTASQISLAVERFLKLEPKGSTPFGKMRRMIESGTLLDNIKNARLGKWGVLAKCYEQVIEERIDIRTASCETLELLPGIGPKTSRFFVMHSRPKQKVAALDTHILQYLRDKGFKIPNGIPTGKAYAEVEKIFIEHAEQMGYDDLAEFDLIIWNQYSKRSGTGEQILKVT